MPETPGRAPLRKDGWAKSEVRVTSTGVTRGGVRESLARCQGCMCAEHGVLVRPVLRSVPRSAVKTARLAAGAWAAAPCSGCPQLGVWAATLRWLPERPLRVATLCELRRHARFRRSCVRQLRCGCEFRGWLREPPAADSCASHRWMERSPRSVRGGAASPLGIARLLERFREGAGARVCACAAA